VLGGLPGEGETAASAIATLVPAFQILQSGAIAASSTGNGFASSTSVLPLQSLLLGASAVSMPSNSAFLSTGGDTTPSQGSEEGDNFWLWLQQAPASQGMTNGQHSGPGDDKSNPFWQWLPEAPPEAGAAIPNVPEQAREAVIDRVFAAAAEEVRLAVPANEAIRPQVDGQDPPACGGPAASLDLAWAGWLALLQAQEVSGGRQDIGAAGAASRRPSQPRVRSTCRQRRHSVR
jgi:hypothetical protein